MELGLLLQVLPVHIVTFVETLGSRLKSKLKSKLKVRVSCKSRESQRKMAFPCFKELDVFF